MPIPLVAGLVLVFSGFIRVDRARKAAEIEQRPVETADRRSTEAADAEMCITHAEFLRPG